MVSCRIARLVLGYVLTLSLNALHTLLDVIFSYRAGLGMDGSRSRSTTVTAGVTINDDVSVLALSINGIIVELQKCS